MKKKTDARNIKKALLTKHKSKKSDPASYISTGCTTLNLACTGSPFGGLKPGHAYLLVGKSSSGKTLFLNTILAQACLNPFYKKYRLINDDAENGNLFDMEKLFSPEIAKRIESPSLDPEGHSVFSATPEDFFLYADRAMKKGPCIYVLDSMDAVMASEERNLHETNMDEREKGKGGKASYGAEKAKMNYRGLRYMINDIKKTGSIVVVVCHSKELIGAMQFQKKETRSGGAALTYFATLELWTKIIETLTKDYKGKKIKTGIQVQIDVIKNRTTGKQRTVEIPVYYSTGLDDIGSCVEFLLEYNHWKKTQGKIVASEFDFGGSEEKLIQKIGRKASRRTRLRKLVAQVWDKIESAVEVHRTNEYRE